MLRHWLDSLLGDELRVLVCPQRISLLRYRRTLQHSFKPALIHQQVLELPQLDVPDNRDVEYFGYLAELLEQALQSKQWLALGSGQVTATIIISNHFVRYAVIPWSADLAIEAERQAYMRHRFNMMFGEAAKSWDLRMSEPAFGQPALASAIDASLLKALHGVCARHNIRIDAVHPHLMLAINQMISTFKKQTPANFWLVVIASGRLCVALVENGQWALVKNVEITLDIAQQVAALIQRESVIHHHDHQQHPVLVYWPESKSSRPLSLANQQVQKLPLHEYERLEHPVGNVVAGWGLA